MADKRVIKVELVAAVQEYKRAMKEAAESTKQTGEETDKATDKAKKYRDAFNAVGTASVAMGTVLSAGIALAASRFASFDAAMSSVQAATHSSAGEMDTLRQAALDAGESTVFSATESAAAIEELAKAGLSTADILNGGLNGALDLAAAGELGVARAAEITSTALNQFSLSGDEASHVADVLAAGAGKAMGSVDDLANGLKFVGPVAASMGVSLEETTGVLALFAQQGIIGEQAGTSLRGVLSSLTSPSTQARAEIERLGLSLYDSSGSFIGLENAAGQLAGAYRTMDGASRDASLGVIFGRETVTAATALYKAGAEGVDEWTTAVDDQGYAAQTAALRLDNLKGDVEALGGAFETALIDTGGAANDTLRTMVQALAGLIGMYNDLPAPVQGTVMALGGAAAAVALTGGAAFLAVPKWLEFKATVEASSMTMKGIGLTAGAAGLALGGLFMVVGELAAQHQRGQARAQAYADAIEDGTNKLSASARDTAIAELSKGGELLSLNWQSAYEAAEKLGIGADTVTDAALKNADAISELSTYYAALENDQDAFNKIQDETGMNAYETRLALESLVNGIGAQNKAIDEAVKLKGYEQDANDEASKSAETAAQAYQSQADAVSDLNSELTALIEQINAANGVAVDAITANADWLAALDGLAAQVEKTGTSLDESSVAGSANAAALGEVAEKARAAADAQFEQDLATMSADDSARKWNETLAEQRERFIESATAAGYNADQVKALADRIFQMPDEKTTNMLIETATAQTEIDSYISRNTGREIILKIGTSRVAQGPGGSGGITFADGGITANGVKAFAAGGFEPGIYPYRSGGIHKFAEESPEAYISMDPRRRDRSYGVWQEVGTRFGFQQQAAPVAEKRPVVVNQEINTQPGMNEFQVAQISEERLSFALRGMRR